MIKPSIFVLSVLHGKHSISIIRGNCGFERKLRIKFIYMIPHGRRTTRPKSFPNLPIATVNTNNLFHVNLTAEVDENMIGKSQ